MEQQEQDQEIINEKKRAADSPPNNRTREKLINFTLRIWPSEKKGNFRSSNTRANCRKSTRKRKRDRPSAKCTEKSPWARKWTNSSSGA